MHVHSQRHGRCYFAAGPDYLPGVGCPCFVKATVLYPSIYNAVEPVGKREYTTADKDNHHIRQPPPRGHVQFGCRRSYLLQSGESSCSAILFTKLKACSAILSTQLKTCSAILIALIDPFSIFPGSLLHSGARVFDKQFQQHSPAEHRLTSVSVEVDGMMVCKIAPEMLVVPHLMANGS